MSPRPTALITGASAGIGAELAKVFAREGFDLLLVSRSVARMERLGQDLARAHGIRSRSLGADLNDPQAPLAVARAADGTGVDVLVNNAGLGTYGPFAATDPQETLRMLQVNVVALTHLTHLLLPAMLKRQAGRILNVASTAAFQPGPCMAVYYASKAYVLHFSEALAEELRGSGVTVTCLCPGPTRTEFHVRARMEHARMMRKNPFVMDAAAVARAGYAGLKKGKRLVIPGAVNWLVAESVRLTPRVMATRVAGMVNGTTS